MEITDLKIDGYEQVVHAVDEATGLNAFIGIHDTTLGPALGGMRIWPYDREEDALTDVLRLSKGMSYKSAVAQTGLGGGKSVIVGDPKVVRNRDTLLAMADAIASLEGRYITAEDVNTRVQDLEIVAERCPYVTGLSLERGGSGNPSPYTGLGVFWGIETCIEEVFGSTELKDRHVVFQGTGTVARTVIGKLLEGGARVTACDINEESIQRVRDAHPEVQWVDPQSIFDLECDVFAPHALGAVINDNTIPRLKCRVIAGAANNQLAEVRHGEALRELGILYAPDFVINAGGIINVSCEMAEGGYREEVALKRIAHIRDALKACFRQAEQDGTSVNQAAITLAQSIIDKAKQAKGN